MRIDAITTCVGELYRSYLLRALPIWLDTLDSLTIATDKPFHELPNASNLHCVLTRAFTDDGAYFNKGKALNVAYQVAKPTRWALSIDADIIPPASWRKEAELRAVPGCINSAYRYSEQGQRLDAEPLQPKGYFQLWHTNDPKAAGQPLFEDWHPHAGHYDTAFYKRWPSYRWNDLKFTLRHQGEKSTHWFGVGAEPRLMRDVLNNLKHAPISTVSE